MLLVVPSLRSIYGIVSSTLFISIPLGLVQSIALRRIFPILILWIISIPIGLLRAVQIFLGIADGLRQIVEDEFPAVLTVGYLLTGFIIGLPQWLILGRQYANSSIWLLGSSIGVAVGSRLVFATDLINQSAIISFLDAVLVYAISTG